MSSHVSPGEVIDAVGSIPLIVLGILILLVRPRLLSNVLAAVLAILFGLVFLIANLGFMTPVGDPTGRLLFLIATALSVPTAISLALLAITFPTRLAPKGWLLLALALPITAGVVLVPHDEIIGGPAGRFILVLRGAFLFSLLLLSLRAATLPGGNEAIRRRMALVSIALFLWPAAREGAAAVNTNQWWPVHQSQAAVVALVLVGLIWLAASWRGQAEERLASRRTALVMLTILLSSCLIATILLQAGLRPDFGPPGVARVASVALLSYAILRHQLLGIDVRVRWTMIRAILAGFFLASFFIITSVADNFLERFGWVIGGLATGLLVFAIYPLQRLAERIGKAVLPNAVPPTEMNAAQRQHVYREAALAAWADGLLGRKERLLLDRLRISLGIDGAEALNIESDVASKL